MAAIKRVGFFLHGENNMNPKRMTIFDVFFLLPITCAHADIEIWLSKDDKEWTKVVDDELEHRAGDHLYDLGATLENWPRAKFARFVIVRTYLPCDANSPKAPPLRPRTLAVPASTCLRRTCLGIWRQSSRRLVSQYRSANLAQNHRVAMSLIPPLPRTTRNIRTRNAPGSQLIVSSSTHKNLLTTPHFLMHTAPQPLTSERRQAWASQQRVSACTCPCGRRSSSATPDTAESSSESPNTCRKSVNADIT